MMGAARNRGEAAAELESIRAERKILTEHERFEAAEREKREKPPTEEDLRHNYVARTAAARAEADKLGEPPLVKAVRVWEGLPETPFNPATCTCDKNTLDLGAEHRPDCPQVPQNAPIQRRKRKLRGKRRS